MERIYIDGSNNAYALSDGTIERNGVIMKPKVDAEGYFRVSVGGKARRDRVHRFIAKSFIPNPYNKKVVNHIDGNRQNNSVDNLEWCTYKENSVHAGLKGLLSSGHGKKRKVIATGVKTGIEYSFESQKEAERKLSIPNCEINKALRGKRKTAHGYKFRYADE